MCRTAERGFHHAFREGASAPQCLRFGESASTCEHQHTQPGSPLKVRRVTSARNAEKQGELFPPFSRGDCNTERSPEQLNEPQSRTVQGERGALLQSELFAQSDCQPARARDSHCFAYTAGAEASTNYKYNNTMSFWLSGFREGCALSSLETITHCPCPCSHAASFFTRARRRPLLRAPLRLPLFASWEADSDSQKSQRRLLNISS